MDMGFPLVSPGPPFHWAGVGRPATSVRNRLTQLLGMRRVPLPAEIQGWQMQTDAMQDKVFPEGAHVEEIWETQLGWM